MKNCPSVFRVGLVSLTAVAICFGVPLNRARAADAAAATNAPSPGVAAAPAPSAMPAPGLPYGVTEVVKMYQGGIGKDVIENYINNTVLPFHLTADGIIYLQSLGVPQEITRTLIQRDGQLQAQAVQYQQYQQQMAAMAANQPPGGAPAGAPGQQPEPMAMPTTPAPQVVYSSPDYPAYDAGYPYPYYGYPYYGWGYPGVVIGGWWGGGWGGYGGFRGGVGGFRGGVGGFRGGGGGFGGGGFRGGGGGGFHGGGGGGGHR